MSYTVSAATAAAVSASISTPVGPVVDTRAVIRTPRDFDFRLHVHMREHQRVAHGDQIRSSLGRADAREARHLQRIAFGIFRELFEYRLGRIRTNACASAVRLVSAFADTSTILRASTGGHNAKAFSFASARECHRPHPSFSRSASATRKALARASAATSPDPCQVSGVTRRAIRAQPRGKESGQPRFVMEIRA